MKVSYSQILNGIIVKVTYCNRLWCISCSKVDCWCNKRTSPFPKSIEMLSEPSLATARSRKFSFTNTFSIVHVCGFPIVMSPSQLAEKLVQMNRSPLILVDTTCPASNPIVLTYSRCNRIKSLFCYIICSWF